MRTTHVAINQQSAIDIANKIDKIAKGHFEWRVQDPITKACCMRMSHQDHSDPEREIAQWFEEHKQLNPQSPFINYEIAKIRVLSQLEKLASDSAQLLQHLATVEARNEQLLAELERYRSSPPPVTVEAVATVTANGLDWLIEGGESALAQGSTLIVAQQPITDDEGVGTVYPGTADPLITESKFRQMAQRALDFVAIGDRHKPYSDPDLFGEMIHIRLSGLCELAEFVQPGCRQAAQDSFGRTAKNFPFQDNSP